MKIVNSHFFSDHHSFKWHEIKKLEIKAKSLNAKLVTTEKDYVRIPSSKKSDINYIPIHIEFESKDLIIKILQEALVK